MFISMLFSEACYWDHLKRWQMMFFCTTFPKKASITTNYKTTSDMKLGTKTLIMLKKVLIEVLLLTGLSFWVQSLTLTWTLSHVNV